MSSRGIALTRFSLDLAMRYTIVAVEMNPLKIPFQEDSAGKFRIATPIMNFMKEIVTSLSVKSKDSLIRALAGGLPSYISFDWWLALL